MDNGHRNRQGQFALGNPGGPGRPRRAVEREYLAALNEAVSLDDWREIVKATAEAAKKGDGKARDWLARYLLGDSPITLTALAADEVAELGPERDILESMAKRQHDRAWEEQIHPAEYRQARKQLEKHARPAVAVPPTDATPTLPRPEQEQLSGPPCPVQ
jgi:hypothetical protein